VAILPIFEADYCTEPCSLKGEIKFKLRTLEKNKISTVLVSLRLESFIHGFNLAFFLLIKLLDQH